MRKVSHTVATVRVARRSIGMSCPKIGWPQAITTSVGMTSPCSFPKSTIFNDFSWETNEFGSSIFVQTARLKSAQKPASKRRVSKYAHSRTGVGVLNLHLTSPAKIAWFLLKFIFFWPKKCFIQDKFHKLFCCLIVSLYIIPFHLYTTVCVAQAKQVLTCWLFVVGLPVKQVISRKLTLLS